MAKRYCVIIKKGRSKEVFWYPQKSNRDSAYATFVRNRRDSIITKDETDRLKLKITYVDSSSKILEYVTEEKLQDARKNFSRDGTISKIERLN